MIAICTFLQAQEVFSIHLHLESLRKEENITYSLFSFLSIQMSVLMGLILIHFYDFYEIVSLFKN